MKFNRSSTRVEQMSSQGQLSLLICTMDSGLFMDFTYDFRQLLRPGRRQCYRSTFPPLQQLQLFQQAQSPVSSSAGARTYIRHQ